MQERIQKIIDIVNSKIDSEEVFIKNDIIYFMKENDNNKIISFDKITEKNLESNYYSYFSLQHIIEKHIRFEVLEKYQNFFNVDDLFELFSDTDIMEKLEEYDVKRYFNLVDKSELDDYLIEDNYKINIILRDKKTLNDTLKEEYLQTVLHKYTLDDLERLLP